MTATFETFALDAEKPRLRAHQLRDLGAYNPFGRKPLIRRTMAGDTRSEAVAQRVGASRDGDVRYPDDGAMRVWRHQSPEACK